jgi:MFS family permease
LITIRRKFKRIFHALTFRNYRLFFSGQAVSILGTWMQRLAMSWLVYRLSDSAFLLGFVEFTGQFPALLLTPIAGVLLDRWNARSVLCTANRPRWCKPRFLLCSPFPEKLKSIGLFSSALLGCDCGV